jgi:hypothetical protein
MPAAERSNREHAEAVSKSLAAARMEHESDWHQIADLSGYGEIPGAMSAGNGRSRPKMRALMDGHPIRSFRTVRAGMYSGLSSPNRPWINFQFVEKELNDYQPAAAWLDTFQAAVYDMFAASNFYQSAKQNYGEMSHFGPAVGLMTEHWREIAPTFPIPIGEYWLGTDDALKVDTLVRNMPMTVHQVVSRWVRGYGGEMDWSKVSQNVRQSWDRSNYSDIVVLKQLIEPGVGEKWNSIIWDVRDDRSDKSTLEEKTFNKQPFWAPRWDVRGVDAYGRGVGHEALPDLRELAMQAKVKRELSDLIRKPPTAGPAQEYDMRPGGHTYVREMSAGMRVEPVYTVPSGALNDVRADIMELRQAIDSATYSDLFMAITQMPGVQPRNVEELIKRDEERLTQIGPVVEMVNDDMLPIAVERMIDIAQRGGLLPEAPEELEGKPLKMEFVSVLALAQKMMGMSTTERFVGFVGSLGQVLGPDVLDKINGDAIIDDYAKRSNVPASAIRDNADVEQLREARAQQAQMAQMAEMAKPASDATSAAKNIMDLSGTEASGY